MAEQDDGVSSAQVEKDDGAYASFPQIGFYHLTRSAIQEALPALLDRTLSSGERAVIYCSSKEEVKKLDKVLWESPHYLWLPHGMEGSDHASRQPVWLAYQAERPPNDARFLFRLNGAETADLSVFRRVFDLFDGHDEYSVKQARQRWRSFKEKGYKLAYWKQESKGWRQAG